MTQHRPITPTRAILGEGPIWHNDRLYCVDIVAGRIHIFDPRTDTERFIQLDSLGRRVVRRRGGGRVVAMQPGFACGDETTGDVPRVADPEADAPGTRCNEGQCDPAGRFCAGTMSLTGGPDAGAL